MEKVDEVIRKLAANLAAKDDPARWIRNTNKLGNRIISLLDEIEQIWNTNVLYEEETEEKGRNRKGSTKAS
jgi:hypothetical protein